MAYKSVLAFPASLSRCLAIAVLSLSPLLAAGQHTAPKSPPKVSAPAAASHPSTTGARTTTGAGARTTTGAGARTTTGTTGTANRGAAPNRTAPGVTHTPSGGTRTVTRNGGEINRGSNGRVTSFKGPNGHEARFGSNGGVREVHGNVGGNRVMVAHGPAGMRRVVVDRPDHSRFVAEGHGRGYIQRPYMYGGHPYYSRAYYYHGGYYRGYYSGYYYHGYYLNGYMPAYYYPPAYYGWAYNPWPAPVPYAWGWRGNPWYGYYGAYFRPYPVYPSPAYWLADYMVSASLADAYAAAAVANAGQMEPLQKPRLIFASYDPNTGVTSPTMTPEVKDAISKEIEADLALQKQQGATEGKSPASFTTLLADGKPHVFVASTGLTVTSAGEDCGLTEGDVLALDGTPAASAENIDLRVLAGKQSDCRQGATVAVPLTDLQEMHNHLLQNIDKGMAEMKDHPGQGGLPAPPSEAIAGIKAAPYAEAAPPADPNGATELDTEAQQGTQLEQQVVAEANAPDEPGAAAPAAASPIGNTAPATAPRRGGPVTIVLGQTPAQVIANKGEPTNKVNFPNKQMYIYPDMKIIFVGGKVSDVQ